MPCSRLARRYLPLIDIANPSYFIQQSGDLKLHLNKPDAYQHFRISSQPLFFGANKILAKSNRGLLIRTGESEKSRKNRSNCSYLPSNKEKSNLFGKSQLNQENVHFDVMLNLTTKMSRLLRSRQVMPIY